MLSLKSVLLSLLLTAGTTNAGGEGGGGGGYTQWFTTTCWETKSAEPVYVTVWEKPAAVTVYNTITQWETKTTTVVSVKTDIITITQTIYSTVNNYYTDTATQTEVQVSHQTATATATATATVISASVFITTEFATVTDTVTEFPVCTTAPLVGLVLCPTRTVNPTYTPPSALPTNYLWGCPPGTLCTPKQDGCNFEPNEPADTYFCSPDECVATPPLPVLDTTWDPHNCTPYIPPPGYANLAPPIFELGYDIFQFNGQAGPYCPPAPSTTWQDWVPPPASSTSSWVDWVPVPPPSPPSSSWVDWPVSQPSPSSVWADWSVSQPAASSAWGDWAVSQPSAPKASSWGDWNGAGDQSHTQGWGPAPPGITPRANLAERQAANLEVPPACYNPCNAAVVNGQSCGLVYSALCPSDQPFSVQYENCGECIRANKDVAYTEQTRLISSFVKYKNFCSSNSAAPAEAASTSESTSSSSSSTSSTTSVSSSSSSSVSAVSLSSTVSSSASAGSTSTLSPSTATSTTSIAVSTTTAGTSTGNLAGASTTSAAATFTGAAALEGRSSNSLLLTIFMALSFLFNIGPA